METEEPFGTHSRVTQGGRETGPAAWVPSHPPCKPCGYSSSPSLSFPTYKMDVIGTTFYNSSVVSIAHDSHLVIVCDESVH